jgi:hypothetical protein
MGLEVVSMQTEGWGLKADVVALIRLRLLLHPPPQASYPGTRLLSHTPWFSAHNHLTTSPLSFPRQAQTALLRAVLVILFLSSIGALGCV